MRALKSVYENERVWPQKLLFSDTPLKEDPSEDTGTRPESRTKKNPNPAAKLTRIRIYKGMSTNNFVRLQSFSSHLRGGCMKRGPAERLSGQIIPDSLLPGFGLTTHTTHITHITHPFRRAYHAYHAYHAPFSSDLPRIPRISRTLFVGLTTHTTHITHHFRRPLSPPGGKKHA
jgi:hypothetical protein